MLNKIELRTANTEWNPFLYADPVTKLLLHRWQLKIGVAAFLVLLVPTLPIYLAAFTKNAWLSQPDKIGLLKDYGWWWYQLAAWPVTILFFFWMPKGILTMINGLNENGVLVLPQTEAGEPTALSQFLSEFAQDFRHWAHIVISFVLITLFLSLYLVPAQRTYLTWTTASGQALFWYVQCVHGFMLYVMLLVATRSVVAVLWFNRLFRRFQVDVKNLHPDGAGGFGPFGSLIVKAGYLIAVYGCTLVVLILEAPYRRSGGNSFSLRVTTEVIPMMILYLPLAPTLFFLILRSGHIAMKKARDQHLLEIAKEFESEYCSLDKVLAGSDPTRFAKKAEKLDLLQQLHDATSRFPVWPIDTRNVTRFFTSWTIPMLIGIAIAVVEWWLGVK